MNSILDSIKKLIGLEADYVAFDTNIIVFINGAFSTLQQMGIGPTAPYRIQNAYNVWSEWSDDSFVVEESKNYVYLQVRKTFDPPANSYVMDALEKQISELGWRLYTYCQKEY